MNSQTHRFIHAADGTLVLTAFSTRVFAADLSASDRRVKRCNKSNVVRACCLMLLMTAWAAEAATVFWVGGSGDWSTPANWSTDSLPGTNDDVVIGAGASITVTHSTGTDAVRNVQSEQAFVLSGGTLTVSNTFQASDTFTLSGGTLQTATVVTTNGASLIVSGRYSSLDGVTVNGVLDVGNTYNYYVQVTVTNGLVLNGTAYVGGQSDSSAYNFGAISFAGSQTLSGNGTVVFGGPKNGEAIALRLVNEATVLTIGPGITVRGLFGSIGYNDSWGGPTNVAVVNQGLISCDVTNGTITINAQPLSNTGVVSMSNGGSLNINYMTSMVGLLVSGSGTLTLNGNWINAGVLNVTGSTLTLNGNWTNTGVLNVTGSTLTLNGNWSNSGTLNATNATVNLGGTFTLASLGNFNSSGSTMNLMGTLNNTNTTLFLNGTSNSLVLAGGAILGGTVVTTNGASLIVSGGGSSLDGVTVNGVLDVGNTYNYYIQVTVTNGLVLNGTAYVGGQSESSAYNFGVINFAGSQTLSGNGTVVFGGPKNGQAIALRLVNEATALTIGPGITVRGLFGSIGYNDSWGGPTNVAVVNQGLISCDVTNGTITINAQPLSNTGVVSMSNGGSLSLNYVPDLTGVVANGNGTLTLNGIWQNTGLLSAASLSFNGSWTNSGTINASTLSLSGGWTNTGIIQRDQRHADA